VSIEETSPDERVVKVEVGESKKPLEYRLRREGRGRRWVVDDLIISQTTDGGKTTVSRSVTDQMDLLLSVRELITDWQTSDSQRILDNVTPDLARDLSGLPPAWLKGATQRVAGDGPLRAWSPEVRMNGDKAVVGLSRSGVSLIMEFKQMDGRWLLQDASWNGGEMDEVRSLRKLAVALTRARRCLEAFAAGDHQQIAELCTPEFASSLTGADLSRAPVPVTDLLTLPYTARQHRSRVDVLLSDETTTYTLNIVWNDAQSEESIAPSDETGIPRVEELTIYNRNEGQVKRLSAMFQSQAVVELFSEMLANRDVTQLAHLASSDFNDRVWRRFNAEILKEISLAEIEAAEPRDMTPVFQGPVTEVTVMQGTRALTYVLHTESGRLVVDDVLMPVLDRPNSLKKHLELLAPIHEFAHGLRAGDQESLLAASGAGLDRIVWQQVRSVPDIGIDVTTRLALPVKAIRSAGTQSRVTLSDGARVAEVELEEERGRFVVADVSFIEGPQQTPIAMLQAMRREIARDMRARYSREILPAAAEVPADSRNIVQPL
jgi:hypothetical protein